MAVLVSPVSWNPLPMLTLALSLAHLNVTYNSTKLSSKEQVYCKREVKADRSRQKELPPKGTSLLRGCLVIGGSSGRGTSYAALGGW